MSNPRLASRYAKSLIDLAQEQNNVDAVLNDMKSLQHLFGTSKELVNLLHSPLVKGDKKMAIFNEIFKEKFNPLTVSFLDLLIKKGRESDLPEMVKSYQEQYDSLKNIETVYITTAFALDETTHDILAKKISAQLNNDKLIFKTIIDPSIVGGFKLQVGDKYFDASISRDLTDIKNQFISNVYDAKIAIDHYKVTE